MEAAEGVGSAFKTAGELWGGAKKLMGDTGFLSKIGTGFSNIVTKAGGLGSMLTGTLSSGWTGFYRAYRRASYRPWRCRRVRRRRWSYVVLHADRDG